MEDLQDLGEFGFIRRIQKRFATFLPKDVQGIGDDCAVIPLSDQACLLVTTDMLVENIHFLWNAISPQDLGYKSLAVNISDIAAMGGWPTYAFLSIALPGKVNLSWLDTFYSGFFALCQQENIILLGGDTTRSKQDVVINVCLLGEAIRSEVKTRSQAKKGDLVCVTGTLGDSAAGLQVLLQHLPRQEDEDALVSRHHRPFIYTKEARWLASQPSVHAMMDVSDGIDSDLRHILTASHVGAQLDVGTFPLSEILVRFGKAQSWDVEELAATGGEDYCLLFTLDSKDRERIQQEYEQNFFRPMFVIGEITEGDQLEYLKNGKRITFQTKGYDHFTKRAL